MKVKITKIGKASFPLAKSSSSVEDYWDNLKDPDGDLSPPIDYWIIGTIHGEVKVGECLVAIRDNRNGVELPGIFYTTPIEEVKYDGDELVGVITLNSIYKIEKI